jgi:hypothetical protein
MRGSKIRFVSESRQSRWQAIAHGKMTNPLFPSLAFLASFLVAFGRLDPFDPRLMYLWVPFSIFGRFQLPKDTRKDAGQSLLQWRSPSEERKREKPRQS